MHVFEDVCVLSTFIIKLIKRLHDERTNSEITRSRLTHYTLFKIENEWQKLSLFQLHFAGLLESSLMSEQEMKMLTKTDKWDHL